MPHAVYERVRAGIVQEDAYFRQGSDSKGLPSATTDQR